MIEQPAPVKSIAWLADGSAIAAMDLDGAIRLQVPGTGEVLRSWDEPLARSRIVAADPSGRRLATVRGETAVILDVDGRGEPVVLAGHEGPVWTVAWDPAGRAWPRPATIGNYGSGTRGPAGKNGGSTVPTVRRDCSPTAATATGWPRSPPSRPSGSGSPQRGGGSGH